MGEALLHASNLTQLLAEDPKGVKIKFRAVYTGLSGRVLRAWGNPMSDLMMEGGAARSDEAILEAVVPADEVETNSRSGFTRWWPHCSNGSGSPA